LSSLRSIYSPLFFSLIPRPPTSPLLPYTTLFRSHAIVYPSTGRTANQLTTLSDALLLTVPIGDPATLPALADPFDATRPLAERADRKSTRLNSSHVKISYAVFCLKKKNKESDAPP